MRTTNDLKEHIISIRVNEETYQWLKSLENSSDFIRELIEKARQNDIKH